MTGWRGDDPATDEEWCLARAALFVPPGPGTVPAMLAGGGDDMGNMGRKPKPTGKGKPVCGVCGGHGVKGKKCAACGAGG